MHLTRFYLVLPLLPVLAFHLSINVLRATAADPPEDDDASILEVIFSADAANQDMLGSYEAVYQMVRYDKNVTEPTTKTARAVGGSAVLTYSVSPETRFELSLIKTGEALQVEQRAADGTLVEVVRQDQRAQLWEFYYPKAKSLEKLRRAGLPSRPPLEPSHRWIPRIGRTLIDYISELMNAPEKDLSITDDGAFLSATSRYPDGSASTVAVIFGASAGLLPTYAASGFDGALSSLVTFDYASTPGGARIPRRVEVHYATDGIPFNRETQFSLGTSPAHHEKVEYLLLSFAPRDGTALPPLQVPPGTEVTDPASSTVYVVPEPEKAFDRRASPQFRWLLTINALVIGIALALVLYARRSRR